MPYGAYLMSPFILRLLGSPGTAGSEPKTASPASVIHISVLYLLKQRKAPQLFIPSVAADLIQRRLLLLPRAIAMPNHTGLPAVIMVFWAVAKSLLTTGASDPDPATLDHSTGVSTCFPPAHSPTHPGNSN